MNIFKQTKKYTSITRILLFGVGVLLSCSVFAVNPSLVEEVEQNTTNIATNTDDISANSFAITALQTALPVHFLGEQYAGGKIFYLDASGQHGLIAALADQTPTSLPAHFWVLNGLMLVMQ